MQCRLLCGVTLFILVQIQRNAVQGCHSVRRIPRRKKIAFTENEAARTKSLREYFAACLVEKVGDIWDWGSVIDYTVLDSNWYRNSAEENCSLTSGSDTSTCWKLRLSSYLQEGTPLLVHCNTCIDEFERDTKGHHRFKRQTGASAPTLCKPPSDQPYEPNSKSTRDYSRCGIKSLREEESDFPQERPELDFSSLTEFVGDHTICGSENSGCNSNNMETATVSDPQVARWPYRLEALTREDSPYKSVVASCNADIFPLASGSWSTWSDCSDSCGGGTRSRRFQCSGSNGCSGGNERQSCNDELCPNCQISSATRKPCAGGTQEQCKMLACCYDQGNCYQSDEPLEISPRNFVPTVRPNLEFGGDPGSTGNRISRTCSALPCANPQAKDQSSCVYAGCCWRPFGLAGRCNRYEYKFVFQRVTCGAGLQNPPRCDDIDECLSNPCPQGYTCNNLFNAFSCSCPNCDTAQSTSCANPPLTTGGTIAPGQFQDGSIAEITCSPGYQLISAGSSMCTAGSWNPSSLACSPMSCLQPPMVDGGTVPPGPYAHGTTARITCLPGGETGTNTAICLFGVWRPNILVCLSAFTGCPNAPSLTGGTISLNAPFPNGASVTITCTEGYQANAPSSSECTAGSWNPAGLSCSQIPGCPNAPSLTGGTISLNAPFPNGVSVTITCTEGYQANAPSSSECTAGSWNPAGLSCSLIVCMPFQVINGVGPSEIIPFDGMLTVTCNPGYQLSHFTTVICDGTRNDNWSSMPPTCQAFTGCLDPPRATCGTFAPGPYQNLAKAMITCFQGYKIAVGTSTFSTCTAGSWNPAELSCAFIVCMPFQVTNGEGPIVVIPFDGMLTLTCNPGYQLSHFTTVICDGTRDDNWSSMPPTCQDINECLMPCPLINHVCANTPGSFTCTPVWSDWSLWGPCSVACGPGGTESRTRMCGNDLPPSMCGGGDDTMNRPCTEINPCGM